jgi:hypothetical protein
MNILLLLRNADKKKCACAYIYDFITTKKNQPSHHNVSYTGVWQRLETPVIHGSRVTNKFCGLQERQTTNLENQNWNRT